MESLSSLITRTIQDGAPLYNAGKIKDCFDLYEDVAKFACEQEKIAGTDIGKLLDDAADEAMELGEKKKFSEGAWVLRHCFDSILEFEKTQIKAAPTRKSQIPETAKKRLSNFGDEESLGYWQDEKVGAQDDDEEGQKIVNILKIIQEYLPPQTFKYGLSSFDDSIRGEDAIDLITTISLVANVQAANTIMDLLLQGGMIVPVSHANQGHFLGGNHLYSYGDATSMAKALQDLETNGPFASDTGEAALTIALDKILSSYEGADASIPVPLSHDAPVLRQSRRATMSMDENEGVALATLCANLELAVERKARKWGIRPRVYENCFVGNEAVSSVIEMGWAESREEATVKLSRIADFGLIYHVTREHAFEDKNLFYAFSTSTEIKAILEAIENSNDAETLPPDSILLTVLKERYRQFAGLGIDDILNSFYGCDSKEGWDLVDLQNWRNNMKRWGFGRREDQDDEMVSLLAPLVLNVDPETWDKTGDEEWESPWGILAQIAIFDQVPRSAFRGKKEAFKWDDLAIRATNVAIEKGYFETAYKSTLNRFVILLPLEHSESWEDQKLGVKLLLQMLSAVAIEDEDDGHSSYEIVKRLEFSKRLSTAFLEHAQVIAKFRRYPHRNKQHGRTTTLEERIWLASDLVPRWAKSQKEEGPKTTKNIISLPVIPLKRLTRGR